MNIQLPDSDELRERLDDLRVKYGVPGAVAAVSVGQRTVIAAAGEALQGSGVPVTQDTTFLIASISKVWTATLIMQLVDEGLVDTAAPVADYLDPPLRLGDASAAATVTVAQLLSHSGGFFGDTPEYDDSTDDAVRSLVASYAQIPQLHRPGTMFSYCNAGYNILGRVIECVTGHTWDRVLRERLIDPLGLTHTSTLPEETMTRPLAIGHEPLSWGASDLVPVKRWQDPRGTGPCGGTLATTAADLLAFARLHITEGLAADGSRLLSAASAQAMRDAHIAQPDPSAAEAWGWGWAIERTASPRVIGHVGNAAGQRGRILVVPELDLALCVLANGDAEAKLRDGLASELIEQLTGISIPQVPSGVDEAGAMEDYLGTFRLDDETIRVTAGPSGLLAAFAIDGDEPDSFRVPVPLEPVGGDAFRTVRPPMTKPITITFVREDGWGTPVTHVAMMLRAMPRLADQEERNDAAV